MGRVTAKAIVILRIEVDTQEEWGELNSIQTVHEDACKLAVDRVKAVIAASSTLTLKIIGNPTVTVVIVNSPPAPEAEGE